MDSALLLFHLLGVQSWLGSLFLLAVGLHFATIILAVILSIVKTFVLGELDPTQGLCVFHRGSSSLFQAYITWKMILSIPAVLPGL